MGNINKFTIKKSDNDKNINFMVDNEFDFDTSELIEDIVLAEEVKNTNLYNNKELIRYKPKNTGNYSFTLIDGTGTTYTSSDMGFKINDINTLTDKYNNSIWIIEIYDSFDRNKQNILYTNFYKPELGNNNLIIPIDKISNQSNICVSEYNSNKLTINGSSFNVYLKIKFFNAGTGKIYLFKPSIDVNTNNTDENFYTKIGMDIINKEYILSNNNFNFVEYINPFETALLVASDNRQPILITDENNGAEYIKTDGTYFPPNF